MTEVILTLHQDVDFGIEPDPLYGRRSTVHGHIPLISLISQLETIRSVDV